MRKAKISDWRRYPGVVVVLLATTACGHGVVTVAGPDFCVVASGSGRPDYVLVADRERVFRLRASDGHTEWSRSLAGQVWSGPVAAGSVAGVLLDDGRELVGLECGSGVTRWRKSQQDRDWDKVWKASRLVGHDQRFILDAADPGRVVSIDAAKGRVVWVFESPRKFPVRYPSAIVPAGKLLLTNPGALDANTGHLAARVIDSVEAVSCRGGLAVLATNRGAITGVDARAPGTQRWSAQASDWNLGSIAVGDGAVVVTTHSRERWKIGRLAVLDRESGREVWSRTAEFLDGAPYELATLDANRVYLVGASQAGRAGSVTAFDLRTGRVVWIREPGGPVLPPVVVAGAMLFVMHYGSAGKELLRLNPEDGSVIWAGPAAIRSESSGIVPCRTSSQGRKSWWRVRSLWSWRAGSVSMAWIVPPADCCGPSRRATRSGMLWADVRIV